jgi:lipoprotein-anchoring transpeptidase ErfK/SrfK
MLLVRLLALVAVLGWAAPVSAAELVVDNADQAIRSGNWSSSSATPGFYGSDYLFHVAGDGSASVFWPFPSAAPSGRYEVFVRWNSGPNRADDATYLVSWRAGSASVAVDQKSGGGEWHSLGTFDLEPSSSTGVTLTDRADGVVIADAVRFVGPLESAADASAPSRAPRPTPRPSEAALSPERWALLYSPASLHAGPDADTDVLASLMQFSYLQVLGYDGEWAYVYNPRARGTAYVESSLLGPSDPPPAWVTGPPPPALETIDRVGRSVGTARVAFYPVDDPYAVTGRLTHNTPIHVTERVQGADGATWYHIDQGFVPASAVRLARVPERTFSGRWIDADLSEPAMLTAYEGNRVVLTTLAIKGTIANQTPLGTFTIGRRVIDETMDSETIGIPRNAPGGYHLEHVQFTQYFTADGASIHYNYWSSNWGYAGSHGCLGLPYDESKFVWDWADLGTPVVIHQ